jgi:hypothetical protein
MLKRYLGIVVALVFALGVVAWGVPDFIGFQGYLTDVNTGQPVPDTSNASLTFHFYGPGAANPAFSITESPVEIENGYFDVSIDMTGQDLSVNYDVKIEYNNQIFPDKQSLLSVPYALMAKAVEGGGGGGHWQINPANNDLFYDKGNVYVMKKVHTGGIQATGDVTTAGKQSISGNLEVGQKALIGGDILSGGEIKINNANVKYDLTVGRRVGIGTYTPKKALEVIGAGGIKGQSLYEYEFGTLGGANSLKQTGQVLAGTVTVVDGVFGQVADGQAYGYLGKASYPGAFTGPRPAPNAGSVYGLYTVGPKHYVKGDLTMEGKLTMNGSINSSTGSLNLTDGNVWVGQGSVQVDGGNLLIGSGNIGIGTGNPEAKIDVLEGEVRFPGGKDDKGGWKTHFNYGGTSSNAGKNFIRGTTIMADNGGQVAIGTRTPAGGASLQVEGGTRLGGDDAPAIKTRYYEGTTATTTSTTAFTDALLKNKKVIALNCLVKRSDRAYWMTGQQQTISSNQINKYTSNDPRVRFYPATGKIEIENNWGGAKYRLFVVYID